MTECLEQRREYPQRIGNRMHNDFSTPIEKPQRGYKPDKPQTMVAMQMRNKYVVNGPTSTPADDNTAEYLPRNR